MPAVFDFAFTYLLVAFLILIALAIITYYNWMLNYWKRKNLPCAFKPTIPFGHLPNPITNDINIGMVGKDYHKLLKSQGHKHGGLYITVAPRYMPVDPEYIKNILQKSYNQFTDRGFYCNEKEDPLSANLAVVGSEKWRYLRSKLSPAFTPGKMKMVFNTMLECAYQLQDAVNKKYEDKQAVNGEDISSAYTMDVIGSCAFGIQCNSFKHPDAEFTKYGKKIFEMFSSRLRTVKTVFATIFHSLSRLLGLTIYADKETTEFFMNVVKDAAKFRKAGKIVRNDILEILIEVFNINEIENKPKEYQTAIRDITANLFVFLVAGYDSSSLTLRYSLYEMAANQNIQDKVRNEINSALAVSGGEITYDAVMNMKYMSQVVHETLRKYPPLGFLMRVCSEEYKIPNTDVVIEKGMNVVVSVLGIHYDPDYYPEPDTFDPERFSEENKGKRVPFTYLPFGEGPKICIGSRFAIMVISIALTVLLKNYKFTLNKKTEYPMQVHPNHFMVEPKTPIIFDVEKV